MLQFSVSRQRAWCFDSEIFRYLHMSHRYNNAIRNSYYKLFAKEQKGHRIVHCKCMIQSLLVFQEKIYELHTKLQIAIQLLYPLK